MWSLYAVNSETGKVIIDINGQKAMAPASNQKLLTSAAALALIGPDEILHTYLEYTGSIKNGVLDGDLFIRGEGDPTLGSCAYDTANCMDTQTIHWVNSVKQLGISKIEGNIIGDDRYFDHMPLAPAWQWTDIGNYYACNTSGLCFNENLYYLFFKPARYVGGNAKVIATNPVIPGLEFLNHMKTGPKGSGDKGFIYAAPWQNLHQLEGTIPAGVREFSIKGAMPDPALFTAQYLKQKLEESNIPVTGSCATVRTYSNNNAPRQTIHTTKSPPLKDIIYIINKKSNNLYAEQMIKIIGKKVKQEGSLEAGIEAIEEWLEENQIDTEGIFIHDGSGLALIDRLSTKFLTDLLITMKNSEVFDPFYHSLPIAGDPNDIGTLSGYCKNTRAAKNLRAKTGSHVRIRAHSGYVTSRSGQVICFSMMSNDYTGSSRPINNLHEKVMVALAEIRD